MRKLKAVWTKETEKSMAQLHGFDMEIEPVGSEAFYYYMEELKNKKIFMKKMKALKREWIIK